jgi:hypothetical protein
MSVAVEWSFDSLCVLLARRTRFPLEWVKEQIAMDDDILNSRPDSPPLGPHITPRDWLDEWQQRHCVDKIPSQIVHGLTQLYFAYTDLLQNQPHLCPKSSNSSSSYIA